MRTGLDGAPQEYGLCAECATSPRHLDRRAVAEVLGLDPTVDALTGITVERFADRPEARADRPNDRPWGHLDTAALAAQVDSRRKDVERRTGGPCHYCGTTLTPPHQGWRPRGDGSSECGSCVERFDSFSTAEAGWRRFPDGKRDLAAGVLAGFELAEPGVRRFRPGLGREVGLLWFHEAGLKKGTSGPFGHVDLKELRRRAGGYVAAGHCEPPPPKSGWPDALAGRQVQW